MKQIRDIEPGQDRREQIENILTPDQKKALGDARGGETDESLNKETAVDEAPEAFNLLKQNYPNPFNPATTIEYSLAEASNVVVEVYGQNGQLITTLVNEYKNAGIHSVVWDAGSHAAGIYICKINAGNFNGSRKMTLIK